MIEHHFTCPYCWQEISILLDPSVPEQRYVEDCEICCNPIRIHYRIEESSVVQFSANILE